MLPLCTERGIIRDQNARKKHSIWNSLWTRGLSGCRRNAEGIIRYFKRGHLWTCLFVCLFVFPNFLDHQLLSCALVFIHGEEAKWQCGLVQRGYGPRLQ